MTTWLAHNWRILVLVSLATFLWIGPIIGDAAAAVESGTNADRACGGNDQRIIDLRAVKANEIEACLRSRGVDQFNSQEVFARPDLPCDLVRIWLEGVYRTEETAPSHQDSHAFCQKVGDAHYNIFGYRPYWESCADPATVTDGQLITCARGLLRTRDSWPRPSSPRYKSECSFAATVYTNGYREGHLEYFKGAPGIRTLEESISCERVQKAIASLVPDESEPCYAGAAFYKDRIAFFRQCMAGEINASASCKSVRARYVEKLIDANGGLPYNLTPYDQQIPLCEEIEAFRTTPFTPENSDAVPNNDKFDEDVAISERSGDASRRVLIILVASLSVLLLAQHFAKARLNKLGYKTNVITSDIAEIVRYAAIFFSAASLLSLVQRVTGINLLSPFAYLVNLYRASIEGLVPDFLWQIGLPQWYADLVSFSLIVASPRIRNALDFGFFNNQRAKQIWTDREIAVRYMNFYHPGFTLLHWMGIDDKVRIEPRAKFFRDAIFTILTAVLGLSWFMTFPRNLRNTYWLIKIHKFDLVTDWRPAPTTIDGRDAIPSGMIGWFHLKYVWMPMLLPPLLTALVVYTTKSFE